MGKINNFFLKLFKKKSPDKPWLDYYSREERKIEFTKKSIYDQLFDFYDRNKLYIKVGIMFHKNNY